MWRENKVISVPCLAEEEEEPEGLWSSLFMCSALGNVEALHKIGEKKFGSQGSRFGFPSQPVTAEMLKSLHRSRTHRGLAHTPHGPKPWPAVSSPGTCQQQWAGEGSGFNLLCLRAP